MEKKNINKRDKRNLIILIVIIAILIGVTVLLFPFFQQLADEQNRNQLIQYVRDQGAWGVFILLGLQLLQVVVAVIPGEVVEVVAGILYGTIGGYILCTVGVLLSSMLVFFTVKKLGAGFVEKMFSSEKVKKLSFLHSEQKLESLTFLLFFIPGTPKDLLTYVMPLTSIKPTRFFIISTIARIPSIISSTYAGATIDEGNFGMTILIFAITGVVGLIGIFVNNRLMKRMEQKKKENQVDLLK